jgi:hypothetical protein
VFEELFGEGWTTVRPAAKPEKGVQLHGKQIGGVFYVRADDVASLLEVNGVLPGVVDKLRRAVA